MFGKFTYLSWLAIFIWSPTLILWLTNFDVLKRYKKTLGFCVFWALVFSIPWDIVAVRTTLWSFPREKSVGLWFADLPLEEHFFIIFVTFMIASLTLVLKSRMKYLR